MRFEVNVLVAKKEKGKVTDLLVGAFFEVSMWFVVDVSIVFLP